MSTSPPFKDLSLTNLVVQNIAAKAITTRRLEAALLKINNIESSSLDVSETSVLSGPVFSGVAAISRYIVNPTLLAEAGVPIDGVFETIQSAVDAAVADGASAIISKEILVSSEVYNENVTINGRGIVIKGLNPVTNFSLAPAVSIPQITGAVVINSDGPVEIVNMIMSGTVTVTSTATFSFFDPFALRTITFVNCYIRGSNDITSLPPIPCLSLNGTAFVIMSGGRTQAQGVSSGLSMNDNSVLNVRQETEVRWGTLNDGSSMFVDRGNIFGQIVLNDTPTLRITHANLVNNSAGEPILDFGTSGATISIYNSNIEKTNTSDWAIGTGTINYSNTGYRAGSTTTVAGTVTLTQINGSTL